MAIVKIVLTKPKQRGSDRKRVSHHICIVKTLGNMSLYYLRALPCICGNLPACDCFATSKERILRWIGAIDEAAIPTAVLQ